MSLAISKDELISITGGRSLASSNERLVCRGAEFDSRAIKGGELFVALKGDTTHGHQFLKVAFDRGASLYLVEDEKVAESFPEPARLVLVSDTLKAFWTLATWWRRKLNVPVVAITGSVGKTTVKELTSQILLQHSRGAYSIKSFNNHVGVPYSICQISTDHQWAVLEMGMNHEGEIRNLTRIAEPDVAVVSIIAPAHIENLGSLENIAKAKLEILEGLKKGGTLVVNGEDAVLSSAISSLTSIRVTSFGKSESCEASVGDIKSLGLGGISFTLKVGKDSAPITMDFMGEHNAMNAACAALAAKTLVPSLTFAQITKGLESFRAPQQRLNVKELVGGRKIIDDAYNANPESMKVLLTLAHSLKSETVEGEVVHKRIGLVLGDMLELGTHSEKFHREVGTLVGKLNPAFLITVGPASVWYREEAVKAGINAIDAESPELAAQVALKLGFDILLVKASRGMKLEKTVATILAREGKLLENP